MIIQQMKCKVSVTNDECDLRSANLEFNKVI